MFARPSHSNGEPSLPGAATIRLFGLGTEARRDLILGRCLALFEAAHALERRERAAQAGARAPYDAAQRALDVYQSERAPYAGCVRALIRAFEADPRSVADLIEDIRTRYRQLLQAG